MTVACSTASGTACPISMVRPRAIEVRVVGPQHAVQLPLMQDEEVVEAFARGTRTGVRSTLMRLPAATRANCAPNLPPLSQMRKRGCHGYLPHPARLGACDAAPTTTTFDRRWSKHAAHSDSTLREPLVHVHASIRIKMPLAKSSIRVS